jgi:hypothetical protein
MDKCDDDDFSRDLKHQKEPYSLSRGKKKGD